MAQKTLSEGTIFFDISVQTGNSEPQMADMFDGAKATLFLRGSLSRSELNSALGSTVTIYDHRAGNGVVLRDFGTQKLLIKMNRDNWADKNKKYDGIIFKQTGETKKIAGYKCEKAEAHVKRWQQVHCFLYKRSCYRKYRLRSPVQRPARNSIGI